MPSLSPKEQPPSKMLHRSAEGRDHTPIVQRLFVSLGVKERFRKLGWSNVILIAGFLAFGLGVFEFARYENYQDCARYELRKIVDALSAEHNINETDPNLRIFWIEDNWSVAQSICSHRYRFDPFRWFSI